MSPNERHRLAARDMALGVAIVVTGLVLGGVSVMQLAHGGTEIAQTIPQGADSPRNGAPGVPAGNGPAESEPGGTRPTTPAPEPARPDEQQQKMGKKPALPPAPAEKVAPPIKTK